MYLKFSNKILLFPVCVEVLYLIYISLDIRCSDYDEAATIAIHIIQKIIHEAIAAMLRPRAILAC